MLALVIHWRLTELNHEHSTIMASNYHTLVFGVFRRGEILSLVSVGGGGGGWPVLSI